MNARNLKIAALFGLVPAVLLGLAVSPVRAQRGIGDKQGVAQQAVKPDVVTLTGKLIEIRTGLCEKTTGPSAVGTHLIVATTGGKKLNIHLGPADLVAEKIAGLKVGSQVSVQAFRTEKLPERNYIARGIRSGETEIELRDAALRPVWAGRRAVETPVGPGPASAGRGPGWGPGRGMGMGMGRGARGNGMGMGMGMGRGARGCGMGMGMGMGMGRGARGNGGCCGMGPGGNGPCGAAAAPAATGGPGSMGMSAAEHENVFALLSGHDAIRRKVEEIPGGVKTTTTATRPELVEPLRSHVRQMALHLKEGRPVRMWEPLFRDVFRHHDEIDLASRNVEGGIEVIETSKNPEVVPLIRAHARKVDAFVAEGHAAARPPWAGGRGMMMRGR